MYSSYFFGDESFSSPKKLYYRRFFHQQHRKADGIIIANL